jgi:flagellar hook protein FlgE
LFYEGTASQPQSFDGGSNQNGVQLGGGLNTLGTEISLREGALQPTANDLDVAVTGNGFFVLHDGDKPQQFSRAGQFAFSDGFLISRTGGGRVQAFDSAGKLGDIALNPLLNSPAKVTSQVKVRNNLNLATSADILLNGVQLFDQAGGVHNITLSFKKNGTPPAISFLVTATEGSTTLGMGTIQFASNGSIMPAASKVNIVYPPTFGSPFPVELDFSAVTASDMGTAASTVAVDSQNGFAAGVLSTLTFDNNGRLNATYTNGQTANGPTLALAKFQSQEDLRQLGGNLFGVTDTSKVELGRANTRAFGNLVSRMVEGSNVDLSQEFSNLIVMQRGFQASSRVVSTANELIQELFDLTRGGG